MVRLRRLASEFHSPEDFRDGALFFMPYLSDMEAYQDFMDGDLSKLFSRNIGNDITQDLTGAAYYKDTSNQAYWTVNLFQSIVRYMLASVFELSPVPLDASEETHKKWEEYGPHIIRACRQAVEWLPSKGRIVIKLEQRMDGVMIPLAVDPQFYIPILDRMDRELVLGHALVRRWYEGTRQMGYDTPNRVTVELYITEEDAALSDGRLTAMNEKRTYYWSGEQGVGVIAGQMSGSTGVNPPVGKMGAMIDAVENDRLLGLWTCGNDDSLFKTSERNIYEYILAITHMRTALTQDVRSTVILPQVTDSNALDENGNLKLNRIRPQYQLAVINGEGSGMGSAIGYVEPPGPGMAQAFAEMAEMALDNLAYSANIPREAFGQNYKANEPGEAITQLTQIWKTTVIDVKDDLSKIMSKMFGMMIGDENVKVGWEKEPFVQTAESDARTITLYKENLISQTTAQGMLNIPIEEVDNGKDNTGASSNQSESFNGRDNGESEGTEN